MFLPTLDLVSLEQRLQVEAGEHQRVAEVVVEEEAGAVLQTWSSSLQFAAAASCSWAVFGVPRGTWREQYDDGQTV
jgi:hypothetical protein